MPCACSPTPAEEPLHDSRAAEQYLRERIRYWDNFALGLDDWKGTGRYYYRRINDVYRFLIPPGSRVIEIGCGEGHTLAALKPSVGVGVDFSGEMLARARTNYPEMRFLQADAHQLDLDETFDYVILSDLVNELWDVQKVLEEVHKLATQDSRIIINSYSRLWEIPRKLAEWGGLARKRLFQNWLTVDDISNLLRLSHFEVIRHWEEILWPFDTAFLSPLCNKFLVKLVPFRWLALTNFVVARPAPPLDSAKKQAKVSVVVAARNEAGNIKNIFERVPEMGSGTEIIFVEGGSSDNTYEIIEKTGALYAWRNWKLFRQEGKGKGDAVRLGFKNATGDVLMILDADLTVPPEDLPRFFEAWSSGKGDFINGVRLVYPMEDEAMRFANLVGNKFFSLAFSWLLGQSIKDTLCGTKVLSRANYEVLAANRAYFGEFDPFGDFDLIFGAAKLNLKIVDLPVRYRSRVYGETNISRWRHGLILLKMVAFGTRRMKFV